MLLDVTTLPCPMNLVTFKNSYHNASSGEVLEVITTILNGSVKSISSFLMYKKVLFFVESIGGDSGVVRLDFTKSIGEEGGLRDFLSKLEEGGFQAARIVVTKV